MTKLLDFFFFFLNGSKFFTFRVIIYIHKFFFLINIIKKLYEKHMLSIQKHKYKYKYIYHMLKGYNAPLDTIGQMNFHTIWIVRNFCPKKDVYFLYVQ
jgi:hypothetical protein